MQDSRFKKLAKLGENYFKEGYYDKAIEIYKKAIELNPKCAAAYYNRGLAYHKKGNYDKAIEDYTKAIELNPKLAEAYNNRGLAYYKKGLYDKAINDYNKAIELNPKYANAYTGRGLAYSFKGLYDKAINDYNKAIELDPELADAKENGEVGEVEELTKMVSEYEELFDEQEARIKELEMRFSSQNQQQQQQQNAKEMLNLAYEKLSKKKGKRKIKEQSYATPEEKQGLSKVAGMKELKELLIEEVIKPIQNPKPYKRFGLTIPNGILLYGPPGCGKTFIARQLAEEIGFYFLEIIPSEIGSPYIHGSVLKIRQIFEEAEKHAPTIIFIDEFEAMVPARSDLGGHQQYKSEEVNEFLVHLNECAEKNIFVIAATNEPEKIDMAIKRTGRLDKIVHVPPPDLEARIEMINLYLSNRPVSENIDVDNIAELLEGYSCSDIKYIIDESARIALKDGADKIEMNYIEMAVQRNPSSLTYKILEKYIDFEKRGI